MPAGAPAAAPAACGSARRCAPQRAGAARAGRARPARRPRERVPAARRRRRARPRSTSPRASAAGPPGWRGRCRASAWASRSDGFQTLMLLMCAGYAAGARVARGRCRRALLVAAIVAAHVILLLGPPLISQDVFGYLGFARLGALHGLDPYTHVAAEAPADAVFPFVGWPFQHSPYGPLFTLASYATAPLGVAGGLWAFKAVAVACEPRRDGAVGRAAGALGTLADVGGGVRGPEPGAARAGGRRGAQRHAACCCCSRRAGAHGAARSPRFRAGARRRSVAGVGHQGHRRAGAAVRGARPRAGARAPGASRARAALACWRSRCVGLIGFGSHALGFLSAVGEQQQLVATHSVPAETARLVGLSGTPSWWRHLFLAAFLRRCSRSRCGAPRAARTGAWRPAGRRSRCCSRPRGCCRGMRSGCCR